MTNIKKVRGNFRRAKQRQINFREGLGLGTDTCNYPPINTDEYAELYRKKRSHLSRLYRATRFRRIHRRMRQRVAWNNKGIKPENLHVKQYVSVLLPR